MNRSKLILGGLVLLFLCSCSKHVGTSAVDATKLYLLVDPFIGTGAHGHTYPGVSSPHGMVQLSPDTRWEGWDACSGYHYSDNSLYGFSHTHLSGTGCNDLSDLLFIPIVDVEQFRDSIAQPSLPKQSFVHSDEEAHAGYYSVKLGSGIRAELTTTPMVGAHRYTFPSDKDGFVVIDLVSIKGDRMRGASLQVHSDTEVSGYQITDGWVENQQVYFYAKFTSPFVGAELYLDGVLSPDMSAEGDSVRGILTFGQSNAPVEVFVGISMSSVEAAKANLESDLKQISTEPTFDEVKARCEQEWNRQLSKVLVSKGKKENLITFYTALYHSLLTPNRTSDADGSYRGMDNQIHKVETGRIGYSTFSLWDTYRALHPLMTLLDHQQVQDYVASMMSMYDESGELPIWPLASGETRTMIGYHAVSVIADAYLRGITKGMQIDEHKMLQAMVASSLINQKGAYEYDRFGMIPANRRNESVSCTLEYSYDDWCIAQVAHAMANTAAYGRYNQRAQNYIHLFDGATSFFRGRNEDGSWGADFNPYDVSRDFTEANAWQYRFGAQHDVYGMIQLYGGEERFAEALDALFGEHPDAPEVDLQDITGLIGQYAHGNEPSHHIAYLYNYVDQPWKTQALTRRILEEQYGATPEGIAGNEDCGQMSAWYVFTAMGMYPVTPGAGEYVLTTPLFEEVTVTLANGKKLSIRANNPDKNKYIKSVALNGKMLDRLYVTYDELMEGGELSYNLTNKPYKKIALKEKPYSQTKEPIPSPVYSSQNLSLFRDSTTFELHSATPNATIYYTLDGSEPSPSASRYNSPITISDSKEVRAVAVMDGVVGHPVTLYATRAEYHQPADVLAVVSGLSYTLYSGKTTSTNDIKRLSEVKSGIASDASVDVRQQDDDFALIFNGYIRVDEDAVYEFQLTSDDGSVLSIWNQPVVLNDGSHSFVSATGMMALSSGLHPIELRYWQGSEGKGLRLLMRKRGEKEYYSPTFLCIK